jgi:hypothetical protein
MAGSKKSRSGKGSTSPRSTNVALATHLSSAPARLVRQGDRSASQPLEAQRSTAEERAEAGFSMRTHGKGAPLRDYTPEDLKEILAEQDEEILRQL